MGMCDDVVIARAYQNVSGFPAGCLGLHPIREV